MNTRVLSVLPLAAVLVLVFAPPAPSCCPAGRIKPGDKVGTPVVNADQSVILIWDPDTKTQHFIRRASFKSEGEDFGFLIPSPSQPELNESGNDAFPYLQKLTEPQVITKRVPRGGGGGCACGGGDKSERGGADTDNAKEKSDIKVLEEKDVAGFRAAVLETKSETALVDWLSRNDYAYSPEIAAWARPYIKDGWKITALKVAKAKDAAEKKDVSAAALRMTFKTDRPLFPYREPDYKNAANTLGAAKRLLRIYFVSDAKYDGQLTKVIPWTGNAVWANKLTCEQRKRTLEMLKLPETTGPAEWFLTEFEHDWPYRLALADVYFSRSKDQDIIKREPIIQYVSSPWPSDVTAYALATVLVLPLLVRRLRPKGAPASRGRKSSEE